MTDESTIGRARFPTTRGSAVRGAQSADAAVRARAWDALVLAYWKPAYKHLRVRWKATPADAEDRVQAFFVRAMEKGFFASYDSQKARFRTFFRVCLDRHGANEAKADARQKRGGGASLLALDWGEAEEEIARAGVAAWASPEECFDREWRRHVFALGVAALKEELTEAGKADHYETFAAYDLSNAADRPRYEDLARARGVATTTITNQLALARRELRRIVLAKLAALTGDDDELRREASYLFSPPGDPR